MKKEFSLFSLLFILLLFSCTKVSDKGAVDQTKNDSILNPILLQAKNEENIYNYEKAYEYYYRYLIKAKELNDVLGTARGHFKLARLDFFNSNYVSTQKNAIQSLQYLKENDNEGLYALNLNLLGLTLKEMSNYKESILYYNRYRDYYLKKRDTLKYFVVYNNNMGNVYLKSGNYSKAILNFNRIVSLDSVLIKYPVRYARALDNKAWSLYKNDQLENVLDLTQSSIAIRKKYIDKPGLVTSYFRLATYFSKDHILKAKDMALQSLKICDEINNPVAKLEILHLLSNIDTLNSHKYFTQYKQLQDSLIKRERNFKDQTAKIRYETNLKEEKLVKQKLLLKKRKRSLIVGTIFSLLFVLSALLFWFQKNKIKQQYVVLDKKNTEIKKQNILLDKQHTTISELQKELHHRVKNNLTLIDSLIEEVKEEFDNNKFNLKLTHLQNRIDSMYILHTLLYKSTGSLTTINLKKYIDQLSINVQHSFGKQYIIIENSIDKNIQLPVDKSFPVGLIINEFLTNSYKYAFDKNDKGIIHINFTERSNLFLLSLSDNGKGLPNDFNINSLTSFGMDVMQLLTKQLEGEFLLNGNNGVSLTIKFPKILK